MEHAKKLFWVDGLRAAATIAVVVVHVSAPVVYQFDSVSTNVWMTGNILDSLGRFCVPVFLMLTGALVLPKENSLGEFFKKMGLRILLPFAFWSLIYIVFNYSQLSSLPLDSFRWIYFQIKDGSSYHLWYVYMIIGLYLFIPILGKWIRNATEKEILFFLFVWFCTLFLKLPIVEKVFPTIELGHFTGYIGYLVLGYYLSIKSVGNQNKTNVIGVVLFGIGVSLTAIGTIVMSNHTGQFYDLFYAYLTPNVIMASVGIFLLYKNLHEKYRPGIASEFISQYSYGIYLSHVLVLFLLSEIGLDWNLIHPAIGIPVTSAACLILSSGLVFILNKLPFGKYISG